MLNVSSAMLSEVTNHFEKQKCLSGASVKEINYFFMLSMTILQNNNSYLHN